MDRPVNWAARPGGAPSRMSTLPSKGRLTDTSSVETVALADGEDLRSLRRDRAWVEVTGFKGGRKYFRKAVLACGEREWRHVEYEYSAEARKTFQAQLDRMSRAFNLAFTKFCDETVGPQN